VKHKPNPRVVQPPPRDHEEAIYGLRACLAVMARRPADILHVVYTPEIFGNTDVAEALRKLSTRKIPYEQGNDSVLERAARSTHHEGICVITRPRLWTSVAALGDVLTGSRGVAVALDRVRNPYNIGAILRTVAFFGVEGMILGAPAPHPALPPDAIRVAEGGTESLRLTRTTDLADTLSRLKQRGIQIVGTDGASRTKAIGFAFKRPTVLVVGNEREGMSERVAVHCDAMVSIAGAETVESLNVAVATGVLVSEMVRARYL
jgi:RNA methyltransferase, TrmH family